MPLLQLRLDTSCASALSAIQTGQKPLSKERYTEGPQVMPKRIQRKRTKGWQMPPNTVSVARPGKWGNPFIVTDRIAPGKHVAGVHYWAVPTAHDAVACFREMINFRPDMLAAAIDELRGKDLACFCRLDQPCHADVLLELANGK